VANALAYLAAASTAAKIRFYYVDPDCRHRKDHPLRRNEEQRERRRRVPLHPESGVHPHRIENPVPGGPDEGHRARDDDRPLRAGQLRALTKPEPANLGAEENEKIRAKIFDENSQQIVVPFHFLESDISPNFSFDLF